MTKLYTDKRAQFPYGAQRRFLLTAKKRLDVPWEEIARMLKINIRTLTDWKREKFTMSLEAVKLLSDKARVPIPSAIHIKTRFWYTALGGRLGGLTVFKKYGKVGGNPEIRKKKWYKWWEQKGKYQQHPFINVAKPIRKPRKSAELAEFTGLMLGDGGISERQLTVTLHYRDDREYIKFVEKLIIKLFGVRPSTYLDKKDSVKSIVVSRTELVRFCVDQLGLKKGNKVKQRVDIPAWIKKEKQFKIGCVRGLIDTDGSVFTHTYKIKNKWYGYKKLAFSNRSKPLLRSVWHILKELGMNPRITRHWDVRLDSRKDMQRYFSVIGSHNKKHLKRYKK